jgi:hypothetical protein
MSDDRERELRIALLEKQMQKIDFDMDAERRRARRETWQIIIAAILAAAAVFAAGHFIR